jgi:hypothetical protein
MMTSASLWLAFSVPKTPFSGVVDMAVFEYQNQVIVNMTVSNSGPRCHYDT